MFVVMLTGLVGVYGVWLWVCIWCEICDCLFCDGGVVWLVACGFCGSCDIGSCLPIWYFCLGFLWVFEFCGFVLVAVVLVVCVLDCRFGLGLRVSMVFAFGLCVWGVVYVVVC